MTLIFKPVISAPKIKILASPTATRQEQKKERDRRFLAGSGPQKARGSINGIPAIFRGYFATSQARCAWCYDSRKTGSAWVKGSRREYTIDSHGICPDCCRKMKKQLHGVDNCI